MDEERLTRAASIFHSLADLAAADREAVLRDQCGDDAELRAVVERLLTRHDDSKGSRPDATPTQTRTEYEPAASTADHIGPYRILDKLGEGGFGEVFAAEQSEPVKRRVALKILKAGMDTKEVLARFEAERHALAMMDHPNIARVLDAGETPQGRPYFVMELIHGEAITEYCDHHRLSMEDRLDLFIPVCHAIQHAHQKGVIHRDVKPSNVLVTLVDGKPVPKVIDFGIAKAMAQSLTEKTLYTVQGQVIGTPAYMSPEQAEMTGLDVDTRTDVYSLGVLLYELLTGTLPFETTKLKEAGIDAMRRIIREEEPPKPSTRISALGEDAREAASRRRTDPARWRKALRRELDWIVMKALEKERDRRYETVNGLAMDIGRYLADQPVMAGPPSAVYRMRKYVKRHRVGVGFAAVVFLALALAYVQSTVQNARIAAARDEAMLTTTSLEEMLSSVAPAKSGRDVTVRETLDATAKTLGVKFKDQPLVEARLRHTVGKTYSALGEYDAAEEHYRRAVEIRRERLGEEDPGTLEARNGLANTYRQQGRYEEAETLARETLEIALRVLGEEHPETLAAMCGLARAYAVQGRLDESETLLRGSLEIQRRVTGEEHPETLTTMLTLAAVYTMQGRNDEAEALQRETLESQRRVLGEEHPYTLLNMGNLAASYSNQDRHDDAEALQLETLEIQRRVVGEEHPNTLLTMGNLAQSYSKQGRHDDAEALCREALDASRRVFEEEHPRTLDSMHNLAKEWEVQGRLDEAEPLFDEILEVSRRTEDHKRTFHTMIHLARIHGLRGRHEEADAIARESLEIGSRIFGKRHRVTNDQRYNVACIKALAGRRDEAVIYLREALGNGYDGGTFSWILDDPDLASLVGDPEAEAIAEEMKRRKEAANAEQVAGSE